MVNDLSCSSNEPNGVPENLSPFLKACKDGDVKVLSDLLLTPTEDFNATCAKGMTGLHYAIQGEHIPLVKPLVEVINVNIRDNNGRTPLHIAAEIGNVEIILLLLNKRAITNISDAEGFRSLDLALRGRHVEAAKTLIKFNALSFNPNLIHLAISLERADVIELIAPICPDINSVDESGRTALHLAVEMGYEEIVPLLIKFGVNVRLKCKQGFTALHLAAEKGSVSVMKTLLNAGALAGDVDKFGVTALHLASQRGHNEALVYLLQQGVDVDAVTVAGLTSLHYAAANNNLSMVITLIEAGASPRRSSVEGFTPFRLALSLGNCAVVNTLLKYENKKLGNISFYSPFFLATMHGLSDVLDNILQENCENINDTDQYGKTPLFWASERGCSDTVRALLKSLANTEIICTDEKKTALHAAAENGHAEVVNMLILGGADTMVKNRAGYLPLHVAVLGKQRTAAREIEGNQSKSTMSNQEPDSTFLTASIDRQVEVIKLLMLDHRSDVNMASTTGDTVLHLAARNGDVYVVQTLVEKYEASVNCVNELNRTPLHLASEHGCTEVVRYLSKKADVNCVDNSGYSPLLLAVEKGRLECIELLVESNAKIDRVTNLDQTVFHLALSIKDTDLAYGIVEYLSKLCKETNTLVMLDLLDKDGNYPINSKSLSSELLNFMVKYGADVNRKNAGGKTLLEIAIERGNLSVVQSLIEKHEVDPLSTDKDKRTPLHLASMLGHLEIVTYLRNISDVESLDEYGYSPLMLAVKEGHLECIKSLLEFNAKLDTITVQGQNILHLVASIKDPESAYRVAHYLMNSCFKESNVLDHLNKTDDNGFYPLHLISKFGSRKLLNLFVLSGADLKKEHVSGKTLYHFAAEEGNLNLVQSLIEIYKVDPLLIDEDKRSSLHLASMMGHLEIVTYLSKLVDVNCIDSNGYTPLLIAIENGHLECIKSLVKNKAKLDTITNQEKSALHLALSIKDPNQAYGIIEYLSNLWKETNTFRMLDLFDRFGNSPLHNMSKFGSSKLLNLLAECGFDLERKNISGKTLLHLAAEEGNLDIVQCLIETHKVDHSSADKDKRSSLHLAAMKGHLEVVTYLSKLADVNSIDSGGYSPLHWAVVKGHMECIKSLLENNAKLNMVTSLGQNVLHLAARTEEPAKAYNVNYLINSCILKSSKFADFNEQDNNGNLPHHCLYQFGTSSMLNLLVANGANVNSTNSNGKTLLHLAAEAGNFNIVQCLKETHEANMSLSCNGKYGHHYTIKPPQEILDYIQSSK